MELTDSLRHSALVSDESSLMISDVGDVDCASVRQRLSQDTGSSQIESTSRDKVEPVDTLMSTLG